MTEQIKILNRLDEMKIKYEVIEHPAIKTIYDIARLEIDLKDANIVSNLFLKNAKGKKHYLVIMDKEKEINLKELRGQLNSSVLSRASMLRLQKYLKSENGLVSPLAIINDKKKSIEVLIDVDLDKDQIVGVNPSSNTSTVLLLLSDLIKLIEANGNNISYINFEIEEPEEPEEVEVVEVVVI